ncbi:MAG: SRPBCC family protein [Bacteroidales bacterium]|nr:SRPBCC family protein [Bacteroidales bacterium]
MESKFESRIGKVNRSADVIYRMLSDFRNFSGFVPADKIKNWQATADECHFTVDMVGDTGLKIIEKEENKLIKITAIGENPYNFYFWIQLKEVAPYDTRIKLTLKVDLNPMLKLMASKPIQTFLDGLIDQFEKMSY